MRIIVISHSHGRRNGLEYLLKRETYDRVIFLGDYVADFESLPIKYKFPPIVVKGRYDKYHTKPEFVRTKIGGHTFHILNGYQYFDPLKEMIDYTKGRDIDIVVYSGTATENVKRIGKVLYINPGFYGEEHNGTRTYAIITIDDNNVQVEILEQPYDF